MSLIEKAGNLKRYTEIAQLLMAHGRKDLAQVQRPGIQSVITEDLEALRNLAGMIDKHTETGRRYAFSAMLEEFGRTLMRELDYRLEAGNMKRLHENLKGYERLIVPLPIDDYSSTRVLTMEFIHGTKITTLSPLIQTELGGEQLGEDLIRAYLDQVLIDGFFHADPHPGNVLLTPDHKLVLLDLGLVAHVDENNRDQLLKMMIAVAEGRGRDAAELSLRMGVPLDDFDQRAYMQTVSDYLATAYTASTEGTNIGHIFLNLCRLSAEKGVRPAPELTMLGKTLLHIDSVSRALDPDLSPWKVVREHSESIMQRHMLSQLSPSKLFSTMLETNELIQRLPKSINQFLDSVSENRFTLNIEAVDESRLMDNLQKIANRITAGLVLAALILGAAMLMRVPSTFNIWGYPGLAMVLFLAAMAGGFFLVGSIFWSDYVKRSDEKK